MTKMLAELCYDPQTGKGDPLRLQAALNLTFYQIHEVLCAPRDREGNLIIDSHSPPSDGLTDEERFIQSWVRRCLPRWRILQMWHEEQERLRKQQEEVNHVV